jgi:truncated hemoglobin YjbI
MAAQDSLSLYERLGGVYGATSGPQRLTGRSMKDSHQHLMITAAEWEAFLDDLQQTLDKLPIRASRDQGRCRQHSG